MTTSSPRKPLLALVLAVGMAASTALVAPAAHAATTPASAAVHHVAAGSMAAIAASSATAPLVKNTRHLAMDLELVSLINAARAKAGRTPVAVSTGIEKTASYWSTQMITGKTGGLAHNPKFAQMIRAGEKRAVRAFGENVAGFTPRAYTAADIFALYMRSPGHRANILNPAFRYVGVVTVHGPGPFAYNTINFGG